MKTILITFSEKRLKNIKNILKDYNSTRPWYYEAKALLGYIERIEKEADEKFRNVRIK